MDKEVFNLHGIPGAIKSTGMKDVSFSTRQSKSGRTLCKTAKLVLCMTFLVIFFTLSSYNMLLSKFFALYEANGKNNTESS